MKRIATLLALSLALITAPDPCFAMMSIDKVSKQKAKELGMQVRFIDNGPKHVWVELEFKVEGKLKDFDSVSLEIREGESVLLGYAPQRVKRTDSGAVVVGFMADRSFLDKVTLSVVTGSPMNMTGHELRVKDFVEPRKAR